MPDRVKPAKPAAGARTTPDTIADALLEEIAQGSLRPGEALRQEELAARFGVSRIPVREALRRLEENGLVTVHPNRGAFVKVFSDSDVVEVFELRLLLEVDLLKRAVPNMSSDDHDAVEGALVIAEKGALRRDWSNLDSNFHRLLYTPARRSRQLGMVMTLRALFQSCAANGIFPEPSEDWMRDHREILEACRAGNQAEAGRLLTDHLIDAMRVIRKRLAIQLRRKPPANEPDQVSKTKLQIKPNCECCDRDLPNGDPDARICTFECTFCARCVDELFHGVCPNCGGDFVRRPTRPASLLDNNPSSDERVIKYHPERERLHEEGVAADPKQRP
jgi:DNA-binding GntR family transcriptional regulator